MIKHTTGDLIGTAQAAHILHVDKPTVCRWVWAGHLHPAHKLPGKNGAYLFHRTDITTLAQQRKERTA